MCQANSGKQAVKSTKTSSVTPSSTDLRGTLNQFDNGETDAEDIDEIIGGATANWTSISTLCNSSNDSLSANTILYILRTKFEPEPLERVANTHRRRDVA